MIVVVADDLTGAAELGAVGLRHGLTARVVAVDRVRAGDELLCVDTDSRSCAPGEAARRAAAATRASQAAGAKWIYKKVDSVLRGNVAVELDAMMSVLDLPRALLLPANPGLGRVIRDGRYFIHGKPIDETDFRLDPEHPRVSSSVRDLLGGSGQRPIHLCALHEPLPESGIIVGEAQTADDLRLWAGRADSGTLAAGGAEFFAAMLAAKGHRLVPTPVGHASLRAARSELFICGSASESTRAFVAEARRRGTPVFGLAGELAHGGELSTLAHEKLAKSVQAALQSHPRVVLTVDLPPVSEPEVARELAHHLTAIAATVLVRLPVEHVYAEGGATAVSLVRHMSWTQFKVVREIAPGVVTLQTESTPKCLLTMKPGSYVWPDKVR